MMTFEDFKKEVAEKVMSYLTGDCKSVRVERNLKENSTYFDGLIVTMEDIRAVPIIYLEQYYEQYETGADIESILKKIASDFQKNLDGEDNKVLNLESVMDFENVKHKIFPKLINARDNERLLENMPHKTMADLAAIYLIRLDENEERTFLVKVTDVLLERFGLTLDELHELAVQNMEEYQEIEFIGMTRKLFGLEELISGDHLEGVSLFEKEPMNILSVLNWGGGAAALLSKKTMESVIEKIGEDFYILPASVNEVIILVDENVPVKDLIEIVGEANTEVVLPEEKLSDSVYVYDRENHEIRIAEI